MLFTTPAFAVFFSLTFVGYWLLRGHEWRLRGLLVASLWFYASWNAKLTLLLLASTTIDYLAALLIARSAEPRRRKLLAAAAIGLNLAILGVCKYANFFLDAAAGAVRIAGWEVAPPVLALALPLGISFYTFEGISYVVDTLRGHLKPERRYFRYLTFILFFPHLVAGPIVRPRDFLPQLDRPARWDWLRGELGVALFVRGLFKKVALADNLALLADPVFANPGAYGAAGAWLGATAYALQIYCDFSGYSDMAVGLAHTLGFRLPANFAAPYLADGPGAFWRRWHMSLSTWLRDYLFIPLGGSRGGEGHTARNLMVVMVLGGLWHGAGAMFLIWGAFHGALLVLERRLPAGWRAPGMKPARIAVTLLLTLIGWTMFRAQSLGDWTALMRQMLGGSGMGLPSREAGLFLGLAGLCVAGEHLWIEYGGRLGRLPAPVKGAGLAFATALALLLMPAESKTFIYFQF